jgi:hypothetical protein
MKGFISKVRGAGVGRCFFVCSRRFFVQVKDKGSAISNKVMNKQTLSVSARLSLVFLFFCPVL